MDTSTSTDKETLEVLPGKYRHTKGHTYEVMGTGILESTLQKMVIYKSLSTSNEQEFPVGTIWPRPPESFLETINVYGEDVPRFTKID
jgi:cyclomaltodextrinase / maltogenic alpha-amylase / neopullulanase